MMLVVILYKEELFRGMGWYILIPAFLILGVFCVVKIILIIRDIYREKKEKREKEIDEACKELYRQLKSGEMDNKQYQKRLTPLKKEKENNIFLLREYRHSALEPLFPDLGYTISDVEEFFKDPRSAGPLETQN